MGRCAMDGLLRVIVCATFVAGEAFSSADEAVGEAGRTWDYVVLGGSIGTQWMEHYGAMIEADLSVEVVYHDHYFPFKKVSELLEE